MAKMKLRVLILDDETDFADELKEFLVLRDFEVYTANTPGEGFESLRRRKSFSYFAILKYIQQIHPVRVLKV